VPSLPRKRQFSAAYKLQVLAELDACSLPGQAAALARREGLYSSTLSKWRLWREALEQQKILPARPPVAAPAIAASAPDDQLKLFRALQRENRKLSLRLARAECLLDIQKKVSALLQGLGAQPVPLEGRLS
jgi:transposase-like protein